jgi:hypothetical protein
MVIFQEAEDDNSRVKKTIEQAPGTTNGQLIQQAEGKIKFP